MEYFEVFQKNVSIKEIGNSSCIIISFFYKQPVNKQLAVRWLSKLQSSTLSLSNSKGYRLNKNGDFLLKKRKIAVKLAIHQFSAVSKAFLGKPSNQ